MYILNSKYLLELSKKYRIESINMFKEDFSSYCVSLYKIARIYLILCNNYNASLDISVVLDRITVFEENCKKGYSYLCVMPMEKPDIELCTHCNGKSFVHFIFLDSSTNSLVYDKRIYYLGSKKIKQLMDIFQNCFDNL